VTGRRSNRTACFLGALFEVQTKWGVLFEVQTKWAFQSYLPCSKLPVFLACSCAESASNAHELANGSISSCNLLNLLEIKTFFLHLKGESTIIIHYTKRALWQCVEVKSGVQRFKESLQLLQRYNHPTLPVRGRSQAAPPVPS
jgi:hypothetical protein